MAGRTRKFNPVLSEQDKATLEKIVSSRTEEIRKVVNFQRFSTPYPEVA